MMNKHGTMEEVFKQRKNSCSLRKNCPPCPPHMEGPRSESGLCTEKLATNCLSYGMDTCISLHNNQNKRLQQERKNYICIHTSMHAHVREKRDTIERERERGGKREREGGNPPFSSFLFN
jgi:hypothetical protein